ncbi:unnamed protein product [Adineta steineri]|nr:unnamed protein product [Adineta steineri]
MRLLDLPDEILLLILKKLNNIDILYSIFGFGYQRLDNLLQENTFTNTLNFVITTSDGDIYSFPYYIITRFCKYILPKIDQNIQYLILDSLSMENILQAGNYPNLTQLKIFNFNDKVFDDYFTVQSSFGHIFQKQITDLILIFEKDFNQILSKHYTIDMYDYILKFFKNLKHLSINGLSHGFPPLTFRNLPFNVFFSSTLFKLSIHVMTFEDCLALLDGRLEKLNTFIVVINPFISYSSNLYHMDSLPNLQCFSLTFNSEFNEYDHYVRFLFPRMFNLKELTLHMTIYERNNLIDGNDINNNILIHMPRLNQFNFHISTTMLRNNLIDHLSEDNTQQTLSKLRFKQLQCIIHCRCHLITCQIFSLPFIFDNLTCIGNKFPNIKFNNVKNLSIEDEIPFNHEFFIRRAWSFPLLKKLRILNLEPQLPSSSTNEIYSLIKYSHLSSLNILDVHVDYIEQFLNDTKTCLPCLNELTVDYNQLQIATENFTKDRTRFNCKNVEKLNIKQKNIELEDFYTYFPLL